MQVKQYTEWAYTQREGIYIRINYIVLIYLSILVPINNLTKVIWYFLKLIYYNPLF